MLRCLEGMDEAGATKSPSIDSGVPRGVFVSLRRMRSRRNAVRQSEQTGKASAAGIEPEARHSEADALSTELKSLLAHFVGTLSCLAEMGEAGLTKRPGIDSGVSRVVVDFFAE